MQQQSTTSPSITREQIVSAIQTTKAIAEAIRELGSVSDGALYAGVMSHLDLGQYHAIIDILVQAKLITNTNHRLVWIGGAR
jgi:hypothetical protein